MKVKVLSLKFYFLIKCSQKLLLFIFWHYCEVIQKGEKCISFSLQSIVQTQFPTHNFMFLALLKQYSLVLLVLKITFKKEVPLKEKLLD